MESLKGLAQLLKATELQIPLIIEPLPNGGGTACPQLVPSRTVHPGYPSGPDATETLWLPGSAFYSRKPVCLSPIFTSSLIECFPVGLWPEETLKKTQCQTQSLELSLGVSQADEVTIWWHCYNPYQSWWLFGHLFCQTEEKNVFGNVWNILFILLLAIRNNRVLSTSELGNVVRWNVLYSRQPSYSHLLLGDTLGCLPALPRRIRETETYQHFYRFPKIVLWSKRCSEKKWSVFSSCVFPGDVHLPFFGGWSMAALLPTLRLNKDQVDTQTKKKLFHLFYNFTFNHKGHRASDYSIWII